MAFFLGNSSEEFFFFLSFFRENFFPAPLQLGRLWGSKPDNFFPGKSVKKSFPENPEKIIFREDPGNDFIFPENPEKKIFQENPGKSHRGKSIGRILLHREALRNRSDAERLRSSSGPAPDGHGRPRQIRSNSERELFRAARNGPKRTGFPVQRGPPFRLKASKKIPAPPNPSACATDSLVAHTFPIGIISSFPRTRISHLPATGPRAETTRADSALISIGAPIPHAEGGSTGLLAPQEPL